MYDVTTVLLCLISLSVSNNLTASYNSVYTPRDGQVLLKYNYNNVTFCMGTVLNFKYVLTTAKCMFYTSWDGRLPNFLILIQEIGINENQIYTVKDIFIHPQFEDFPNEYNLAIIELETKFSTAGPSLLSTSVLNGNCTLPVEKMDEMYWLPVNASSCGFFNEDVCILANTLDQVLNGGALLCNGVLSGIKNELSSDNLYLNLYKQISWINSHISLADKPVFSKICLFFVILWNFVKNILI